MSLFVVWCRTQLVMWHPVVSIRRLGGVLQLLTWAGHDHVTVSAVVALWQALDGDVGWVGSMMVVVGRKKRHGNV